MNGVIDAISSTGKGFKIEGNKNWFNKGKPLSESIIPSLKKGDKVEFDVQDDKWIMKLSKLGEGDGTAIPGFDPTAKAVFSYKSPGIETSNAISRGCAVNAVFGSPYIADVIKGIVRKRQFKTFKI